MRPISISLCNIFWISFGCWFAEIKFLHSKWVRGPIYWRGNPNLNPFNNSLPTSRFGYDCINIESWLMSTGEWPRCVSPLGVAKSIVWGLPWAWLLIWWLKTKRLLLHREARGWVTRTSGHWVVRCTPDTMMCVNTIGFTTCALVIKIKTHAFWWFNCFLGNGNRRSYV